MNDLAIETSRQGDVVIVRLRGSADMGQAASLDRRLGQFLREGSCRLVLDLAGLAFASSMALGAFIRAHVQCRARSGRLLLLSPQPALLRVLQTTRLTDLFEITSDLEEAVSRAASGGANTRAADGVEPTRGRAEDADA